MIVQDVRQRVGFPGTTFEKECDKWAAAHPEEAAEVAKEAK